MSNLEEKGLEKANKLLDKINSSKHIRPLVQAGLLFMKHSMQIYSGYATLYILMAMIPLLMFVVSVVNMIPSFSVENISSLLSAIFPELPQIHNMIEDIVLNLNSQSSGFLATTTALIMFWSASNGVSAIQKGLEEINEKKSNVVKGKVVSLLFTLVVVVVLVFLMLFQLLRQPLMDFVVKILTTLRLTNAIPFFTTFMQYSYLISIATSIISIVMIYTILPSGVFTSNNISICDVILLLIGVTSKSLKEIPGDLIIKSYSNKSSNLLLYFLYITLGSSKVISLLSKIVSFISLSCLRIKLYVDSPSLPKPNIAILW